MASKSKGNREYVIMDCTEAPGSSRYMTEKNKRKHPDRLELMKYNPTLRKHTLHREKK
jgi:large subunit ribosomal protein L33